MELDVYKMEQKEKNNMLHSEITDNEQRGRKKADALEDKMFKLSDNVSLQAINFGKLEAKANAIVKMVETDF